MFSAARLRLPCGARLPHSGGPLVRNFRWASSRKATHIPENSNTTAGVHSGFSFHKTTPYIMAGALVAYVLWDEDDDDNNPPPPPADSAKKKGVKKASEQREGRQLMLGLNKKCIDSLYDLKNGKKLGQGGCGAVFLAREKTGLKRLRVIKVIHKTGGGGMTEWAKDFTALRELDHPAICRVYDMFQDDKNVYVVMQHFDAGDLADWISASTKKTMAANKTLKAGDTVRLKDLDEKAIKAMKREQADRFEEMGGRPLQVRGVNRGGGIDVLDKATGASMSVTSAHVTKLNGSACASEAWVSSVMRQVVEALAVAHSSGVAHLDLKPANVMLSKTVGGPSQQPHATLIDFGIATPLYKVSGSGTPIYMAPELFNGDSQHASFERDMWAVGCILYELLAGRRAFADGARTMDDVVRSVCAGSADWDRLQASGASQEAVDLCKQLLQMEAILRPSAVETLNHAFFDKGRESLDDLDSRTALSLLDTMKEAARRSTFQRATCVHVSAQLDIEPTASLTHVFTAWDKFGSGHLSIEEVQDGIDKLPALLSSTSRSGDADDLALAMDVNGTGKITFTEWCAAVMDARTVDRNLVKAVFDRRAEDAEGQVKNVNLYQIESVMRSAGVDNDAAHAEANRIGASLRLRGRDSAIDTRRVVKFFEEDNASEEIKFKRGVDELRERKNNNRAL